MIGNITENKTLVRVTEEHIKNATPSINSSCPIALAVMETFSLNSSSVEISQDESYINGLEFDTSEKLDNFMERFDNKEMVEPFDFYFEDEFTLRDDSHIETIYDDEDDYDDYDDEDDDWDDYDEYGDYDEDYEEDED